jgi:hypothetical protein
MNANSGRAGRWMGWRPISLMAFALMFALLLGVQVSHAQSEEKRCLRDAGGFGQGNVCTSNELGTVEIVRECEGDCIELSCEAGTNISVTLRVKLKRPKPNPKELYDIGLFIAEDGGNAVDQDTFCYRDYLHPVSADNSNLDLTDGYGRFYNGEIDITQLITDTCGDLDRRETHYVLGPVRIKCSDANGDGEVDLGTVVSWDKNANADPICTSVSNAVPNESSKCRSQTIRLAGIEVKPSTATLVVQKVLQPPDEARFNLEIYGEYVASDVGDGGSTGPVEVSASDMQVGNLYTVGETAGSGTSLADYDTRIHCLDEDADEFSANDAGPLSVYLQPRDYMTCTITNTLRGPGIEIEKLTDPPGLDGSFPFTSSFDPMPELSHGGRVLYDELEDGGVYTFTEIVPEGWRLASIDCIGPSDIKYGDTSVTITYTQGVRIDCTFTDEPLVFLEVTKTADPTTVYEPGGLVEFEVKVENTGPVDLTLTSLSDDVYLDITDAANPDLDSTTCSVPQLLPAGGSYTCRFEAEVTGVVGDEQTDTVLVTATDPADPAGAPLTGQDEATVLILGEPPYTGVGLAPSLVVGGLAAIGAALLGLGLLMRRRMPRTR